MASADVESAAVLGVLFSYLRSHSQISSFLYAYQDLRQKRVSELEDLENKKADFRLSQDGLDRTTRDELMKPTLDNIGSASWEDESYSALWWLNYNPWAYNAFDAAEDWWEEWGSLRERSNTGDSSDFPIQFSQPNAFMQGFSSSQSHVIVTSSAE